MQCNCTIPDGGFCNRHQCYKTPHWVHLCQTNPKYRGLWEQGRGPGQKQSNILRLPNTSYITTAQLVEDTARLLKEVPNTFDAVVGLTRSGMIPATIVATYFHRPLYACSRTKVMDLGGGVRFHSTPYSFPKPIECRHVLVVDDTAMLNKTRPHRLKLISRYFANAKLSNVAIYSSPEALSAIQFYHAIYPGPHYLEWNLFNSGHVAWLMTDMDGVLCEDIRPEDDDDSHRYLHALQTARPIPQNLPLRYPVQAIVTARLEKYREVTEAWLRKHRILYNRLIMGPWKTHTERWLNDRVAKFKAHHYGTSSCWLFVESSPNQSQVIHRIADKDVLCPQLGRVLGQPTFHANYIDQS